MASPEAKTIESRQRTKGEFNLGMLSLLSNSTAYAVFLPVGWYANVAWEAGFSGLEYWPMRVVPELQAKYGLLQGFEESLIRSAHQSFRGEKNLGESWRHPNRLLALQAFLALPHRDSSLQTLQKLKKALGRENLPVVVFPETPREFLRKVHLTNALIQPAPELLAQWGVNTLEEFVEQLEPRGFSGFCLDTHNFRRSAKSGEFFPAWQETLHKLLPHTKEVQISVGRTDMADPAIDTLAELRDILNDHRETDIFPILQTIKEAGFEGPFVVEIPFSSIQAALGIRKRVIAPQEIVRAYKQSLENIRAAIG